MKKAVKAKTKTKKQLAGRKVSPRSESGPALVLLVLDESGSMSPHQKDVIGGVNSYVAGLANDAPKASLASVIFSTYVRAPGKPGLVTKVPALTTQTYHPSGLTSLFDAVRVAVETGDAWEASNRTGRVVVTIYTDGYENASTKTTSAEVIEMVRSRTAKGWEFIYLGAVADAWGQGQQLGVAAASTFHYDTAGTQPLMAAAGRATARAFLGGQSVTMTYSEDPVMAQAGLEKAKKKKS